MVGMALKFFVWSLVHGLELGLNNNLFFFLELTELDLLSPLRILRMFLNAWSLPHLHLGFRSNLSS